VLGRNAQHDFDSAFGRRMRAHVLDLFVDGRFGDFAFLDVLHQPAIPAHETDVQLLFRLVPLAANHHAVSIAIGLRAGDDRRNDLARNFADALEQIRYLLVLDAQLRFVADVLVLAAAATAEIPARRLDALGRGHNHPRKPGPREVLFDFRDFRLHLLADKHEGDEHDKIFQARHAFTAERDVTDPQIYILT